MKKICCFLLTVIFAGCSWIQPDTTPAEKIDPAAIWFEQGKGALQKGWPEKEWWKQYDSAQLNGFVEQALEKSPTIQVAQGRVLLAAAQANALKKSHYPMFDIKGLLNEQHTSDKGFLAPYAENMPALGFDGPWYTTATVGVFGSYSLDIFGKNRRELEASVGAHNAAMAEKAEVELQLTAAVVQVYWEIQFLYKMRDILTEIKEIESLAYQSEKEKVEQGIASDTKMRLSKSGLAKAKEQVVAVEGEIAALRESLKALVDAKAPLPEIKPISLAKIKGQVPETLGYELIARRPDLQAANWYIMSSLSRVDAAKAAFYPSVDIMGFLGLDTIHLNDLFTSGATQFNLIGGLNLPIFKISQLNANLKVAHATSDLNIAVYNEAVVQAVQNVSKDVLKMNTLEKQKELCEESVHELGASLSDARAHHESGLSDTVAVKKANIPVLLEKMRLLGLEENLMRAQIGLIKDLGGGYLAPDQE